MNTLITACEQAKKLYGADKAHTGLKKLMDSSGYAPRTGCRLWLAGVRNTDRPYGSVRFAGRTWSAHVLMWTLCKGPVPAKHVVWHTCGDETCVQLDHLRCDDRSVWMRITRPVTACPRGHVYDKANTRLEGPGWKRCRTCDRERSRVARAARKLLSV